MPNVLMGISHGGGAHTQSGDRANANGIKIFLEIRSLISKKVEGVSVGWNEPEVRVEVAAVLSAEQVCCTVANNNCGVVAGPVVPLSLARAVSKIDND